jgi:hypothetical protein
MKRNTSSCCGTPTKNGEPSTELPEQIRNELDAIGGFQALADRVPPPDELEKQSRIHHALSDPLRLTIIYLIRDQPLCVCVINRFTRISGSKLSYHLSILRECGLVESEYHGNWIIYTLTEKGKHFIG